MMSQSEIFSSRLAGMLSRTAVFGQERTIELPLRATSNEDEKNPAWGVCACATGRGWPVVAK